MSLAPFTLSLGFAILCDSIWEQSLKAYLANERGKKERERKERKGERKKEAVQRPLDPALCKPGEGNSKRLFKPFSFCPLICDMQFSLPSPIHFPSLLLWPFKKYLSSENSGLFSFNLWNETYQKNKEKL